MNKVFAEQIGRIMEVYIHDMVIKAVENRDHCKDLQQIFSQIRKFNMHLNWKSVHLESKEENFSDFCLPAKE